MKVVGLLGVLLVPLRRLLLGLLPVPLRRLLLGVLPVLLQVVLLQLLPERNPGLLVSPTMWADTPRPGPSSASRHRASCLPSFATYYYVLDDMALSSCMLLCAPCMLLCVFYAILVNYGEFG
jgi:hypothetical protein